MLGVYLASHVLIMNRGDTSEFNQKAYVIKREAYVMRI
jgi:hypothetical protein